MSFTIIYSAFPLHGIANTYLVIYYWKYPSVPQEIQYASLKHKEKYFPPGVFLYEYKICTIYLWFFWTKFVLHLDKGLYWCIPKVTLFFSFFNLIKSTMTICLSLIKIPDVESWTKITTGVVTRSAVWQYETDQSWSNKAMAHQLLNSVNNNKL